MNWKIIKNESEILELYEKIRYEFLDKRSCVLYQQIKWLLYFLTKFRLFQEIWNK